MAGFAFRLTSGYVSDGAGDTYVLADTVGGSADEYPTVRNSETFGWTNLSDTGGGAYPRGRDRSTGVDVRVAGINFNQNGSGQTRDFRVDRTGSQNVRLAGGDQASSQSPYLDIRDSGGSKTVAAASTGANEYVDATDVVRTSDSDWGTNNALYNASFTDYVLIRSGDTGGTGNSVIAYLNVTAAGSTTTLTPANASLSITGFAPTLRESLTPASASLAITGYAPVLQESLTPAAASLAISTFAPSLRESLTPTNASLSITGYAPTLRESLTPSAASLSITGYAPSLVLSLTPSSVTLTIILYSPSLGDVNASFSFFSRAMPRSFDAVTVVRSYESAHRPRSFVAA